MTKSTETKITEIQSYLSTKTKHTKNHLEFFRLVNIYNQDKSSMTKNDKQKLQHIISIIYTERKLERDEKKIRTIETKEKEKKRKRHQRLCFVFGGFLMSLMNEYDDGLDEPLKKIPRFYFLIYSAIDSGIIDYEKIPKDLTVSIEKNRHFPINSNNVRQAVKNLRQEEKDMMLCYFFDSSILIRDMNDRDTFYAFEKVIYIKDNIIGSCVSIKICEFDKKLKAGFKVKEEGELNNGWHEAFL